MNQTNEPNITAEYITKVISHHSWAATGVSDYPPRDPLVGQSSFYYQFRQFIRTVDQEADNFAHVFAVIGEWGRGKSRLGHELIAQINDCSRGWYVRDKARKLTNVALFDDQIKDGYLALYIRYSQIASEHQNSDNWFGYGLYKALLPLATKQFDDSIQSSIAKQALRRLEPMGFDPEQLAKKLELAANHSDEELYYDDHLVTGLVQAAKDYLHKFGIDYVLVVLDELETVAEAATFGLERDDAKQLDGQAIRLIGHAIKEEDPRRKLPWLRYVALCSPLLGQQLREIQSTARRFELVELENNAFADVADYVGKLEEERKLAHSYPTGLVQAAYVMSGANFGWFNVIMANVDVILDDFDNAGQNITGVGELFETVLTRTGRVKEHVLDHGAINGIKSSDRALLADARNLLFGQLPVSLAEVSDLTRKLVAHLNEYDEPVASLYRKVQWDSLDCIRALEEAKFKRNKEEWEYPSVEQGLSLSGLLENLKTFAIHEPEGDALLIPLEHSEFRHLVQLLYNHPAAEYAADALWNKFIGGQKQLAENEATHIGPSVAMLLRLDLRYRSQQNSSLIFRDPDDSNRHSEAMKSYEKAAGSVGGKKGLVQQTRLTGLYRLLDRNWQYGDTPYPNRAKLTIMTPPKRSGKHGGLLHCDGLKLHPKNQAWFAWVDSKEELDKLHEQVAIVRDREGRVPVMAFTASIGVNDHYVKDLCKPEIKDDILLYHLNASEVDVMEQIGLLPEFTGGLELTEASFTTKFKNRLNSIRDFAYKAIHTWRHGLTKRGLIAWPLRPTAKISEKDRKLLVDSWRLLCIDEPGLGGLYGLNSSHGEQGIDAEALGSLFERLRNDPKVQTQGYEYEEQAGLFSDLANPNQAQAHFPPFLAHITNPAKGQRWDLKQAKSKWYWGYLWSAPGLNAKNVFDDWMWLTSEIDLLKPQETGTRDSKWVGVTLAGLESGITAAENWLDGDEDEGYRNTVEKLEKVYGSSRIRGLFAPKGARTAGTQTTHALTSLRLAREQFVELKLMEEQDLAGLNPVDLAEPLRKIVHGRNVVLQNVASVYSQDAPAVSLDNYRLVNLEDRKRPLYSRIEEARLFADRVELCDQRICEQVKSIIAEMSNDPETIPPFPRSLFTLTLTSISNILDGVMRQATDGETASTESGAGDDTLHHFLRDLQIDKATERLELLGQEVGYDLVSDQVKPLAEVDGFILSAFRVFKQRFLDQRSSLEDYLAQVAELHKCLDSPPQDYPNPAHLGELASLKSKLLNVQDSFEDLVDNGLEMREQYRGQFGKGLFKAITDLPDRLLKPIKGSLAGLGGQVNTIDLSVKAYLKKQLNRANGILVQQLETLFRVGGKDLFLMQASEFDGLTLLEVEMKVNIHLQKLRDQATEILVGTEVDVDRWLLIAEALLNDKDPGLTPEEQTALVQKGILQVKVTFGG